MPSRVNPGEFYALPQSPQYFKQLLMISGFDRYFQIVRCFRDEDLRADRQPEFTQIDIEISFPQIEELFALIEGMMVRAFRVGRGIDIPTPFPRLTYQEAMDRFGKDAPDTRFGMELCDITPLAGEGEFAVFRQAIEAGGQVKGLNAKGCAGYSRKDLDDLTAFVKPFRAKGLAWMKVTAEGIQSPIARFFPESTLQAIMQRMGGEPGDLLLLVADKPAVVADALGICAASGRTSGADPAAIPWLLSGWWISRSGVQRGGASLCCQASSLHRPTRRRYHHSCRPTLLGCGRKPMIWC